MTSPDPKDAPHFSRMVLRDPFNDPPGNDAVSIKKRLHFIRTVMLNAEEKPGSTILQQLQQHEGRIHWKRMANGISQITFFGVNMFTIFRSLFTISFKDVVESDPVTKETSKLDGLRPFLFAFLAIWEIVLISGCLYRFVHAVLTFARAQNKDEDAFETVSKGFLAFGEGTSVSGLKYLPRIQVLKHRHGKWLDDHFNIPLVLVELLYFSIGGAALYLKIESLEKDVLDKNLSEFSPLILVSGKYVGWQLIKFIAMEWPLIKFIMFVRQFMGIIGLDRVRLITIEGFLFSGEDCHFGKEEEARLWKFRGQLCKALFDITGDDYLRYLRWYSAWASFNDEDLQKLAIKKIEKDKDQ